MERREILKDCKRVVIKVGSSLLADLAGGVDVAFLQNLTQQISLLVKEGRQVVLVSSGAVAAGCAELGLTERPTSLPRLQAAAAVGQCALMRLYREAFIAHGIHAGQVLLTRDDLNDRARFLHARNTFRELMALNALAIVNENDTVAVAELKLKMGDNDSLAVTVAQLIDAEAILILSDVPGLYDRHPDEDGAQLIKHVQEVSSEHFAVASGSVSGVGSGGMATKLDAARGAAMGSVPLVVADGKVGDIINEVFSGQNVGTFFAPSSTRTNSRNQWIAFGRPASGALHVDSGAVAALSEGKKSLLPIGVKAVEGVFSEGDTVSVMSPEKVEIGRGLVNFSSVEANKILGKQRDEVFEILGCNSCRTIIHRDNYICLGTHK